MCIRDRAFTFALKHIYLKLQTKTGLTRLIEWIKETMVYSSLIVQLDQYCLPLVYYSLTDLLQGFMLSNFARGFSSIAAIFSLLGIMIFLATTYKVLNRTRKVKEFEELQQNLQRKTKLQRNFRLLLILRKFIYGFIFAILQNFPQIQLIFIFSLAGVSLGVISYSRPFKHTNLNILAISDEICLLSVTALLFIQAQVEWFPTKETIGWAICSIVWLNLLNHILTLVIMTLYSLYSYCKEVDLQKTFRKIFRLKNNHVIHPN
eukprot:TRINITY_DN5987_c0_g1_i2.p1 TRINITY_DN5987_c0_g1~~TRINITY_DN5987_c0_g1_i2.p1  ORF type:complete len:262 (+),score=31.04 TRINITY_DN5987_c0_g1_i2:64-849(+)